LLPDIILKVPIHGETAERLKDCFPEGVIKIKEKHGEKTAVVDNARLDTGAREVFRHPELASLVEIQRIPDHFICMFDRFGFIP
jgi:hypothetical protein